MAASDQDARKSPESGLEAAPKGTAEAPLKSLQSTSEEDVDSGDFDLDIDVDFDLDDENSVDSTSGVVGDDDDDLILVDDDDDDEIFELSEDDVFEDEAEGDKDLVAAEEEEAFDLFEYVETDSTSISTPSQPISQPPPPPPPIPSAQKRKGPITSEHKVIGRVNLGPSSTSNSSVSSVGGSNSNSGAAFKDIQRRKQELEGECLALEAQLEQALNRLKTHEGRLGHMKEALDASEIALNHSEAQRKSLVEQISLSIAEGDVASRADMETFIAELEAEAEAREKEHLHKIANLETALEGSVDESILVKKEELLAKLEDELGKVRNESHVRQTSQNARIERLEAELSRVVSDKEDTKGKAVDVEKLVRDNESLRFRIQTLEPALEMSRKKNETYRNDVSRMKKAVEKAQKDIAYAQHDQESANESKQALEESLALRERELEKVQRVLDAATSELETTLEALEASRRETIDAQDTRDKLREGFLQGRETVKAQGEELETLQRALAETRARIEALEEARSNDAAATEEIVKARDEANARTSRLEADLEAQKIRAKEAEEALNKSEESLDAARAQREALQRKTMEAARERERTQNEELKALKASTEAAAAERDGLKADLDKAKADLEAQAAQSAEALEEVQVALKAAQDNAEAQRERLEALQAQGTEAASSLESATSARTALENERGSLMERNTELQAELEAARAALEEARRLADEAPSVDPEALAAEAREEVRGELDGRIEALKAQLSEVQTNNNALQIDRDSVLGELETLKALSDTLRVELEEARAQADKASELEMALQSVRADVPSLDVDLDLSAADSIIAVPDDATVVQDLDALEAEEAEHLSRNSVEARNNADERVASLEAELSKLKEDRADLDAEREVLQVQRDALEEEIVSLREGLDASIKTSEANQATGSEALKTSEAALAALKEENEELKRSVMAMASEFEVMSVTADATQQGLSKSQLEALNGQIDGLRTEIERLGVDNESLRKDLDANRADNASLQTQLQDALSSEESAELRTRITELEAQASSFSDSGAQVEALRAEYEDLAEAYESLQQSHFERGKQLMSALADAERMRANLVRIAQELSAVREEADNLARHNEQIEATNEGLTRRTQELEIEVQASSQERIAELEVKLHDAINNTSALERRLATFTQDKPHDSGPSTLSVSQLGIQLNELAFDQSEMGRRPGATANEDEFEDADGAYPRGYVLADDELSVDDSQEKPPRPSMTQAGVGAHFMNSEEHSEDSSFSVDDAFDDDLGEEDSFFGGEPFGPDDLDFGEEDAEEEAIFGSIEESIGVDEDFDEPVAQDYAAGIEADDDDESFGDVDDDFGEAQNFFDDEVFEELESIDDSLSVNSQDALTVDPMTHLENRNLLDARPSADFGMAKGVDHRAGFLLAMANGETTIKDIIELSSSVLDNAAAAQLVVELIESGAMRV